MSYRFGLILLIACSSIGCVFSEQKGIFSTAYETEATMHTSFSQQATAGITQKLNILIKSDEKLGGLSESCGGCDVLLSGFDTAVSGITRDGEYGLTAAQYFDPRVTKSIDTSTITALDEMIRSVIGTIQEQVDEQINIASDIRHTGLYNDGDDTNSPFDLMTDIFKIEGLFFESNDPYDGYQNTLDDGMSGIITGKFETGEWAQGDTYHVDIMDDIAQALGQKDEKKSDTQKDDGSLAGDCESGYCITLDVISNQHYLVSSGGNTGEYIGRTYEGAYFSVMDWLTKRGDKRNVSCKTAPAINKFQSNNDLNLFFKNIFRGLSIFISGKTPPFLGSGVDTIQDQERTQEREAADVEDVLSASFAAYGISPDMPSDLLHADQQSIIATTLPVSRAGESADLVEQASQRYDAQVRARAQASLQRKYISDESYTPVKGFFQGLQTRIRAITTSMEGNDASTLALNQKPNCGN